MIGKDFSPILSLRFGAVAGVVGGLAKGGYAYLSLAALRLTLWRTGAMPLAYIHFLDERSQRILLNKVQGRLHLHPRLLLDYFAAQYTGPETIDMNTVNEGK